MHSKSLKMPSGLFVLLCGTILAVFLLALPGTSRGEDRKISNWLCYYGTIFGSRIYSRFDLVVLDSHRHPPLLHHSKNDRPILIGYLSIGEARVDGPHWATAKGKPYLVKKNPFWNSWIVDIRDPAWQRHIFETAIPAIFKQGFDGLFLDTSDSSLSLVQGKEKKKFEGIGEALEQMVRRIKETYPDKYLCINRGLPILPSIASYLDFVVVEDLYSYYAGHDKGYVKVNPEVREGLLGQIEEGMKVNPKLTVLTLDYAGDNQKALALEAIALSRKRGFIPYVGTYELDQIFFYTLDQ
jgi:polysaccharide biosynthesis protein PelA